MLLVNKNILCRILFDYINSFFSKGNNNRTIILLLQAYEKIAYLLTNLGKSVFLHSFLEEYFFRPISLQLIYVLQYFNINFSYIIVNKSEISAIGYWTILCRYRELANLVLPTLKCLLLYLFSSLFFHPNIIFFKIFYSMYTIYTFVCLLFMYTI